MSARRALALLPFALVPCALLGIANVASATIDQKGNLRVQVASKISPRSLPRDGKAPISVSVSGNVSTTDETLPPQLRRLEIEINRNGRLEYKGLPVCELRQIQPATNQRALAACRPSLVGQGSFEAFIVLKGEAPYPAKGRLLVFYGERRGKPTLLGHIYLSQPFASSFVIPFGIESNKGGSYGTVLNADLAKALGNRRYLTGIELNLRRTFFAGGKKRSFLSSGCPAPKGFGKAVFPMVRTSFDFAAGKSFALTVTGECEVR